MTKTIALAGACGVILALWFSARQGPKNEDRILEGTLEDINGTVAVVKDKAGKEHMFWLLPEHPVDAQKGDSVAVRYSTGKGTGRKVKNIVDIRKI